MSRGKILVHSPRKRALRTWTFLGNCCSTPVVSQEALFSKQKDVGWLDVQVTTPSPVQCRNSDSEQNVPSSGVNFGIWNLECVLHFLRVCGTRTQNSCNNGNNFTKATEHQTANNNRANDKSLQFPFLLRLTVTYGSDYNNSSRWWRQRTHEDA